VCCSMLQYIAARCSVILRCVAGNSSTGAEDVLQCVAVCCSMLQCAAHVRGCCSRCAAVCYAYCSVLQHTAACCIVSHCVAGCCRMLQCADSNKQLNSVGCQGHVAACCSVLQCVAVCCSV